MHSFCMRHQGQWVCINLGDGQERLTLRVCEYVGVGGGLGLEELAEERRPPARATAGVHRRRSGESVRLRSMRNQVILTA
jgi:hypothetical protein